MNKSAFILGLIVAIISIIQLSGCLSSGESKDENIKEGFLLSKKYCGSCHQLPEPNELDKITWAEFVLPKMAGMLGFQRFASDYISVSTPVDSLTLEQWRNIVRYYVNSAPEKLELDSRQQIELNLPFFTSDTPRFRTASPATTLVVVDTVRRQLIFGDGLTEQLYSLHLSSGKPEADSTKIGIGISHLYQRDSIQRVLTMGVMHPSDVKNGRFVEIRSGIATILIDTLQRPVHARYVDLNNDGLEDVIISEFGNATGHLCWFEKTQTGFRRHMLRALPGSVKTEVYDFNKDGKPDIIALMAQGDEGFFIYYNQGNGQFKEERVLRFLPSHGSNYFELVDWNRDGFPDILASNGDNGDYPPILKPYHGISLYLNDGKNGFSRAFFLPINGVGKVLARDFDVDGDPDLASISYFPDFRNHPEESFIFWQNEGDNKLKPFSFPGATAGRWLTMDAADLEGDGDIDIVLGNAKFPLGAVPPALMKKWEAYSPSVLILRNSTR